MLDILGEDFIRMARSQGLGERRVTIRQTLRAAMTPVATQLGIDVGTLTGRAP
jgi:peptide/nickel transport system permease protein